MQNLVKKVDALMRFALAETPQRREEAQSAIRSLLDRSGNLATDPESVIRSVLLDLGVPDRVLGHGYLATAIRLVVEEPLYARHITTMLYPTVGRLHGSTKSKAERAIRHAVELAFDRGDTNVLYKYFGNTVDGNRGKATNSEFIIRIANYVRSLTGE